MADYVVIRIHKQSGRVSITDESGRKIPEDPHYDDGKIIDEKVDSVGVVKHFGQAFWISDNPTCVYHNGKRYCG